MSLQKRTSILIVEDDLDIRAIFQNFFENLGYFDNIVVAQDGIEAHLKLRNQKFDFIILDFNIPKKNAAILVEQAQMLEMDLNRVLICSGELDKNKLQDLISMGIRNFLTKPCTLTDLQEKVNKMLKKYPEFKNVA